MSEAIEFITQAQLPTAYGEFVVHVFEHQGQEHLVLTHGTLGTDDVVLTRVHSECLTGDGLFSLRCDCGPQLAYAMEQIAQAQQGMIIYLRQEGRGIGLTEKIKAYHLQDQGLDTFDANVQLGHPPDNRNYDMLAGVFQHLAVTQVRLMTNNPDKIKSIESQGVQVVDRVPIKVGHNPHNQFYLKTKKDKFLHLD
ncbi:GTP cyclohydrolase II [Marinicella meishanensis]|uniref:GTP cyclohydrolase II n=1 Tax=Marinicella meishanensis TaxID=2873263 RepID=UPI001CBCF8C9|nr:GTP cyclohydrolase II [Marinicella sp. NBU2979]